jgi:hypothetical protein
VLGLLFWRYILSLSKTFLQTKFGEQSIDSEDFFSTISQFLLQFKKVVQERLPCTTGPRLAGLAIS